MNYRVELSNGEVIENVTRVVDSGDSSVNIHTPGKGYRIVDLEEIERIGGMGED